MAVADDHRAGALLPLDERIEQVRAEIDNEAVRIVFDRAMAAVDRRGFERLRDAHRDAIVKAKPSGAEKYLDLPHWFMRHAQVFHDLGLDEASPSDILDIGSGGGHFLSICKIHGHRPLGLDRKWPRLYAEMCGLFGVERVEHSVVHGVPFPEAVGRFDMIVIHAQNFDKDDRRGYWTLAQWAGFLEYLTEEHMQMPARLFMRFNRRTVDGKRDYFWPLLELAAARGAAIGRKPPKMLFELESPLQFDELEPEWSEAVR